MILAPASWSEYGEWNACSVSCGEGTQERMRQCGHPDCWDNIDCAGSETDTQICTMGGKACGYVLSKSYHGDPCHLCFSLSWNSSFTFFTITIKSFIDYIYLIVKNGITYFMCDC